MTAQNPKPSKTAKASDTLKVTGESGVDQATMLAKIVLRPSVRAAAITQSYSKPSFGDADLTTLVEELGAQIKAVHRGDLQRAEAMLIGQAHSLEAIFQELTRRAGLNLGEYIGAAETYMRLALKAQSQCRATLETLATIKNPPVAFVRQANIAHGPQQVNNAAPPDVVPRAGESEFAPNKLLEHSNGERLDFGTPSATGKADSSLETVGAINGAAHAGR